MSKPAAWKGTERRIAQRTGGKRIGHLGGPVDVDAGWLQVQCKHRQSLPKWLTSALAAVRAAVDDGQLGVLVLHEHGQPSDGDVIVCALGDWLAWFGGGNDG